MSKATLARCRMKGEHVGSLQGLLSLTRGPNDCRWCLHILSIALLLLHFLFLYSFLPLAHVLPPLSSPPPPPPPLLPPPPPPPLIHLTLLPPPLFLFLICAIHFPEAAI